MYRENIVINRVREDVARQRYKQAFSKVRKGIIVCVSHCIVPPEIPKMSGSDILLLHLPDTNLSDHSMATYYLLSAVCTMSEEAGPPILYG